VSYLVQLDTRKVCLFRDESFQAMTCTSTDSLTNKLKTSMALE